MLQYALVFIGGGLGSVCRFVVAQIMKSYQLDFPLATLVANAMACVLLGLMLGIQLKSGVSLTQKMLIMTGFCGGFSTFSTFSGETLQLFQAGQILLGFLNILVSLCLCLICLYVGMKLV